ncbi:MAG: SRPBCC family protein [Steroidobacteraceae bacterium]
MPPHLKSYPATVRRCAPLRAWTLCTLCTLWTLLGLAAPACAAQVSGVHVRRDGARFLIRMHIAVNAPPPAVFRALTDYAALSRYNPDLRAVRVEPTSEPNRVRLFATIHTCVLFFCKTMHQEQIMTAVANPGGGILRSAWVPEHSDFKQGHGRWTVTPCASGRRQACMDVQIELVPAFAVPPVIGPWLVRRKMYQEAQRTGAGIEQVARDESRHVRVNGAPGSAGR